jgi:hypothetical protein
MGSEVEKISVIFELYKTCRIVKVIVVIQYELGKVRILYPPRLPQPTHGLFWSIPFFYPRGYPTDTSAETMEYRRYIQRGDQASSQLVTQQEMYLYIVLSFTPTSAGNRHEV